MPKIVFACQSNSCRSQMAEGWAREWMRQQLEQHSSSNDATTGPTTRQRLLSTKLCSVALNDDIPDANRVVKAKAIEAMADSSIDISSHYVKTLDEALPALNDGDATTVPEAQTSSFDDDKPIDKLIVLCSCGDRMREKLERLSNHVQVWNIEAPSKVVVQNGMDSPYRRVSLQIRDRIYQLMEQTILVCDDESEECCTIDMKGNDTPSREQCTTCDL